MGEKTLNWKQILFTALVTGTVTLVTGMLIYYLQTPKARLLYSVENTIPFEGPSKNFAIYHVNVENRGNRITRKVVCQISSFPAKIEQSRVSAEPTLAYQDSASESTYRVEFPSLNPHESVVISILSSGSKQLAPRPKVSLRGEGVAGTEAPKDTGGSRWWQDLLPALASAFTGMFAGIYVFRSWRQRSAALVERLPDAHPHGESQRMILSYLCGIHGLVQEAKHYLDMSIETTYWAEADRMSLVASQDPTNDDTEKRKRVLKDLLVYNQEISKQSIAIIHFNIAKIAICQEKSEECDAELLEARKYSPEIVETRLSLDPVFKSARTKYFPLVEYVKDSLGFTATKKENIVDYYPPRTLRPGDSVEFVVKATDPFNEPLQYKMEFWPGIGDSRNTDWTDDNTFRWQVLEADISKSRSIRFVIRSKRTWHAQGSEDDSLLFHYKVFPRPRPN